MSKIQQIIDDLTDEQCCKVISDYKEYKDKGFIGDCLLRDTARRVSSALRDCEHSVTFWMDYIVNSVHAKFAQRYIEMMNTKPKD